MGKISNKLLDKNDKRFNKIFNESDMNLSYIAWKGTTINRKTMLQTNI